MTFSIVGRSADGTRLGVAVASKFLAVGAYVPAARATVGAVATQAEVHLGLKPEGLRLLAEGLDADAVLDTFLQADAGAPARQAGVVGADGSAATRTGADCLPWAGGTCGTGPEGSFAVQGNVLTGPEVLQAMVGSWQATSTWPSLARRLSAALAAGDAAGGDRRGRQSAALLVVGEGAGYGGTSDVEVDLRVDDHADPVGRLGQLLDLHELYFGTTPEADLLAWDDAVQAEVAALLAPLDGGAATAPPGTGDEVRARLRRWMSAENFEERWHATALDPVVLEHLRTVGAAGA